MNNYSKYLYLVPIYLLIVVRLGVEVLVEIIPIRLAWIPSFLWYWLLIYLSYKWMLKKKWIEPISNPYNLTQKPSVKWLLLGVIIPALLPLPVFVLSINKIPFEFILYILIFSCVNPWFEELFWRYQLSFLKWKKWKVVLYSASLFSFSHYWFWLYWFKEWEIIIPTLFSTFIMGLIWMKFLQQERKYVYLVISHFFVDVFNLSAAVYYGVDLWFIH